MDGPYGQAENSLSLGLASSVWEVETYHFISTDPVPTLAWSSGSRPPLSPQTCPWLVTIPLLERGGLPGAPQVEVGMNPRLEKTLGG